ncbi:MAG TPA: hypothetical protein PKD64_09035 [Pirellulaceae bacterium]|nr:hypothetical protein [Pirellulaceae bacterium]HMO92331.1 hypothetical protein [Pirellulaceae bacterium]HMP69255.1 hypothetical protein [Pirellulaceae bacterium]
MIKKTAIVSAGAILLLALLFGKNLVPYAKTAFERARNVVNENVPVEFQLDAARKQLNSIEQEKTRLLHQIAKEQVAIANIEKHLNEQQAQLDVQHANIMRLRNHVESGETHFVSYNRKYTTSHVKEDLAKRFANFKVANETLQKTGQMLDARRQNLESTKSKLDQMNAEKQSLALEIENLQARMTMLDVAKQSNSITVNNSPVSQTRRMVDEIKARLDVEEEFLALTPSYAGSIPMAGEAELDAENILEEIDIYFTKQDSGFVKR